MWFLTQKKSKSVTLRSITHVICALGIMTASSLFAETSRSPLMRGGMKPQAISLDLKDATTLYLRADIGPDTYNFDQAIWGDALLFRADGTQVRLSDLKPKTARVGYATYFANKDHTGAPLSVGGVVMTHGIYAHAPSLLTYDVTGFVRFQAEVGICTIAKENGSVVFTATTEDLERLSKISGLIKSAQLEPLERLLKVREESETDMDVLYQQVIRLEALKRIQGSLTMNSPIAQLEAFITDLNALRYDILVKTNPAINFDEILFIRRKGNLGLPANWQSNSKLPKRGFDNALTRFSIHDLAKPAVELYRTKNKAFIGDLLLHWDAERLLFSSIGSNGAWHIFEMALKDNSIRQVTQNVEPDINHYDACYTPEGDIILTCTALKYAVPCVDGDAPVANLFRCKSDGSGLEMLANDQEHAWSPRIMPDGRVLYTRWEYADLPHSNSRILFTCNPDGTNQRALYGSNSFWPNSFFYTRPIPGKPQQLISIISGHHGVKRKGEMILFDISRGTHEAQGVVQRLPGYGKTVEPLVRDQLVDNSWPKMLHPYPLNDTTFLVASKPTPASNWGIYLIDIYDNMLLLHEEEGIACLEPNPIRTEKMPPAIPDRINRDDPESYIYIADIYEGPGLAGIPRGVVEKLRVYTYTYGFHKEGGLYGSIGIDGPWDMRRILGTVPIKKDGSAFFRAPANTPIAIQPLDKEGKSLQVMRSWFTGRPGEYLSCIGCHEESSYIPTHFKTRSPDAPDVITPWRGPVRNYEFVREVQPVLDRHCIGCHSGEVDDAGQLVNPPDLRGNVMINNWKSAMHGRHWGGMAGKFSKAYVNLFRYARKPGIESDMHLQTPMEWHVDNTELMLLLSKGHHGVELDEEAMDRLITWIDLNGPYHGRWQSLAGEAAIRRENVRIERRKRYLNIDENHEEIDLPPLKPVAFKAPKELPPRPAPVAQVYTQTAKAPQTPDPKIDLGNGITIPCVPIPGGSFVMGSAEGYRDELPQHVQKVKPFYMGQYEITNAQFRQFDPKHDSRIHSRHGYQFGVTGWEMNADNQPVVRISWYKAQAFCEWLSEKIDRTVRLPTEAEWEWAARAECKEDFWWGERDADFGKYANLADISLSDFSANPYIQDVKKAPYKNTTNLYDNWIPQIYTVDDHGFVTEPVGKYKPTPWGLYDIIGNAAEWTSSIYKPYPYVAQQGKVPTVEDKCVIRGGSFWDRPKHATPSFRRAYRPYQPVYNVGFRIVVE